MSWSNDRDVPSVGPPSASASAGRSSGGTEARLARVEAQFQHAATKADIEGLESFIEGKRNSMMKWLPGILVSSTVALLMTLAKSLFD